MNKKNNLGQTTVKCHGNFKSSLKVNSTKSEVTITFVARQETVDLNKLASILNDGATAIFVSDQTELPTDDDKNKGKDKPAKGQLSLVDDKKKASND